MDIESILKKLETEFISYEKVMIALSGGVDSCLAAYLARKYLGKDRAVAVISDSPSLKRKDLYTATRFCNDHDIKYEIVHTNELDDPNYFSNPHNRCYFCKNELYDNLNDLTETKFSGFKIINGNNYSDLGDYRPGLNAADEQSILSPFIKCKVTKENIRELARKFNLSVWDKPASPCLSSRFPYGEEISLEKLKRVEEAESILNGFGFDEVRVRSFGDTAKIEVPSKNIAEIDAMFDDISDKMLSLGFSKCELDKEGFVSGKMNRVLK